MKKTIIFILALGVIGFFSSLAQSNSQRNVISEMLKDENQAPKKVNKLKSYPFFDRISSALLKNNENTRNYILKDILKDQLDKNKIKTNKLKSNPKLEGFMK